MAIEKKWDAVPPKLLTADGGNLGQIQVADTAGLKVKQIVSLHATGQDRLLLEVKRVLSDTVALLGVQGQPITQRSNLSAYTVAAGAFIVAEEQDKTQLKPDDKLQATYDQEPTVAWRNVMVDQYGRYYNLSNPLPVQLSNGSISIGTVNAELEVELTHRDNYPDPGDVHDSVRIGGPSGFEAEVGANGGLNVNLLTTAVLEPSIENIAYLVANVEDSFTFPLKTRKFLIRVRDGMAKMRIAYAPGDTATQYFTVNMGCIYAEDIDVSGKTIYFQLNKANQIIELLYWTEL